MPIVDLFDGEGVFENVARCLRRNAMLA